MDQYIAKLYQHMKNTPDQIALFSENRRQGLSYQALERNSGKVYSWLKSHSYGREDIILICLPRGIRTVVAMIGILRTGAAFTVVESTYAPERIAFIQKDCGCRLTVNEEIFNEMMDAEPLDGYEQTDPHDAAFVVYTSGSTGTPKGALHEYGELEKNCLSQSYDGKPIADAQARFALLAPLNFVASVCAILSALVFGCAMYIVPYSTVKDKKKLSEFLEAQKLTHVFMAPSLLRAMKSVPKTLRRIILGAEPANGVWMEGVELFNFYGMSESGFIVATFRLDHAYDTTPIGKPQFPLEVKILNENGLPVKDGETGELCFENQFFRGYLNLEEKTKAAVKNGIFHSGDLAKTDENGNIVILGRKDDMIKINGNRIEPAEIEAAVSGLLGVETVVAKGFRTKTNSCVAVYYRKADAIRSGSADADGRIKAEIHSLNETLLKRLPYYMLPSYYIGLDDFPIDANGKIAKRELPMPEVAPFRQYVAPRNETEAKICRAFSEVLQCQMGIHDDFYQCGGDSLAAISFLSQCDLTGISIGDLFKCRTAAKLAEHYAKSRIAEKNIEEGNARSIREQQPLLVEQLTILDFQFLHGKSTMWNLSGLYPLRPEVDLNRLADAIKKAIFSHPVFLTVIDTNEDGDFVQYYDESVFEEIKIIRLTEDELESRKPALIQVMKLLKNRLYNCCIFQTETGAYLFLDVHHILTDGTSLKIFRNDIVGFYRDGSYTPQKDYYYYALYENATFSQTAKYQEALAYYKQFDDAQYRGGIPFDFHDKGFAMGYYSRIVEIRNEVFQNSSLCSNIGKNGLFAIAAAMAEVLFGNCKKVQVNWLNNGRDNTFKLNVCGLMYKVTRLYFDFDQYSTLADLYEDLKYQLHATISYGLYPRTFQRWEAGEENIGVFYQKGIYDPGAFADLISGEIELPTPNNASDAAFDIEMIDSCEGTELRVQYSASNYRESTIMRAVSYMEQAMKFMLQYEDQPDMSTLSLLSKIDRDE